MSLTLVHELMLQDGVKIPSCGPNVMIRCVNPNHNDKEASLSFHTGKGIGTCHACGFVLTPWHYLKKVRGWSDQQVGKFLKEKNYTTEQVQAQQVAGEKRTPDKKGELFVTDEIPNHLRKKGRQYDRHKVYNYHADDGSVAYKIAIFVSELNGHYDKTARFFTPGPNGDMIYWCGPMNERLPDSVRRAKYSLYNLAEIRAFVVDHQNTKMEDRPQIWIVEGEKCVDMVKYCGDRQGRAPKAITTLSGGSSASKPTAILRHDLEPLRGQRILLLPDADAVGREHMKRLGIHLQQFYGCECRIHITQDMKGRDIADQVSESGYKGVQEWIKVKGNVIDLTDIVTPEEVQEQRTVVQFGSAKAPVEIKDVDAVSRNDHFQIIGMEDANVLITRKGANIMYVYQSSELVSQAKQITLAPMTFWCDMLGLRDPKELTNHACKVIGDWLMRYAESLPKIRPDNFTYYNRGAARLPDDSVAYNVGSHILTPDMYGKLTFERRIEDANNDAIENGMNYLFEFPPTIKLDDDMRAAQYAKDLFEAIKRYRWSRPSDGDAFCGWLVTSIIGGALEFRPALWLRADSGTGKTYLFDKVLKRVLGTLLYGLVDTTEAGLEQIVGNDSMPVYIDEFEPSQNTDDTLKLMRLATSGESARVRGSPAGRVRTSRLRFSLILGSVDLPKVLSDANENRIRVIELSQEGVDDFNAVHKAIHEATTLEKSRAIITHIIRHTKLIVEDAERVQAELVENGHETREAQMQSALTAGVRFLTGDAYYMLPERERAKRSKYQILIDLFDQWVTIRTEGSSPRDILLRNAIYTAYFDDKGDFNSGHPVGEFAIACLTFCEQVGLVFHKRDGENLLIFQRYNPLDRIFKRIDAYANLDYTAKIKRMPLVTDIGRPRMFANSQTKRPSLLKVDRDVLREIGFFQQEPMKMDKLPLSQSVDDIEDPEIW